MKANELRIGNFVLELRKPEVVGKRTFENWDTLNLEDHLHPIPLTEEWLKKAGFEKRDLFTFYYDKLCIRKSNPLDKFDQNGRTYWNSWTIIESQPNYVHQLQNLYFALTGEELEFK